MNRQASPRRYVSSRLDHWRQVIDLTDSCGFVDDGIVTTRIPKTTVCVLRRNMLCTCGWRGVKHCAWVTIDQTYDWARRLTRSTRPQWRNRNNLEEKNFSRMSTLLDLVRRIRECFYLIIIDGDRRSGGQTSPTTVDAMSALVRFLNQRRGKGHSRDGPVFEVRTGHYRGFMLFPN